MTTIVNYGMGNLASIQNMLKKVGEPSFITSESLEIQQAEKLILPGVGAFHKAMSNLNELALHDVLIDKATQGVPILGICLGMQLLADDSEEGNVGGLGLVPGHVRRFRVESHGLKVPHMCWNKVSYNENCPLFEGFNSFEFAKFYFVHSYFFESEDETQQIATTIYGIPFTCGVQKKNVFGVQFHPEKSHKFGMKLLDNFKNISKC